MIDFEKSCHIMRIGLLMLLFSLPILGCGDVSSVPGDEPKLVKISLSDLYLRTYGDQAKMAARVAKVKSLTLTAYYTQLLENALDTSAIVAGYQIPNSRQSLLGLANYFAALGKKYPTVGDYWQAVHYSPTLTVSEVQFRANLSTMFNLGDFSPRTALGLGAGFSRPNFLNGNCTVKAPENESIFFSGSTDGIKSQDVAEQIAAFGGGWTIYDAVEANTGKTTPPGSWTLASSEFARCAKGKVLAIIGKDNSLNGMWATVELPALKENPNVKEIRIMDPSDVTYQDMIKFRNDKTMNQFSSNHMVEPF